MIHSTVKREMDFKWLILGIYETKGEKIHERRKQIYNIKENEATATGLTSFRWGET